MKVLAALVLFSSLAFAEGPAVRLKPGLWKVQMLMIGPDGKAVDPAAQIKAALAALPEKDQKEILAKMGGAGAIDDGINICMTEAMVKDPGSFANHDSQNCESKVLSESATTIKSTFTCKDGSKGESTWKMNSPSEYEGHVHVTTAKAGKTSMKYHGKLASKDCGEVKPLTAGQE